MTSTLTPTDHDRRTCRRVHVERPCKIMDAATGRYVAAMTVDVSQHGIMVRLAQQSNLKPGDEVLIGVAMHERQGIIQAKEMIESRVVRRLDNQNGETTLAVQFVTAMQQDDVVQPQRRAA